MGDQEALPPISHPRIALPLVAMFPFRIMRLVMETAGPRWPYMASRNHVTPQARQNTERGLECQSVAHERNMMSQNFGLELEDNNLDA